MVVPYNNDREEVGHSLSSLKKDLSFCHLFPYLDTNLVMAKRFCSVWWGFEGIRLGFLEDGWTRKWKIFSLWRGALLRGRAQAVQEESGAVETRNSHPSPTSSQCFTSRMRTLLKLCDETKPHTETWLPARLSLWFSRVWEWNECCYVCKLRATFSTLVIVSPLVFFWISAICLSCWVLLCPSLHEYWIFRRAWKPSLDPR